MMKTGNDTLKILCFSKPYMVYWIDFFPRAILGTHSLIYKKKHNKVSCFSRISLWWKPPYGEKNQLMKVHLNPFYPIFLLYHRIMLLWSHDVMNLKIIGLIHFRQIRWIIASLMESNLTISIDTMKGGIYTTNKPSLKIMLLFMLSY